jgi:hypothetical protein
METIEKIKAIINNENVSKAFFNLFDRWRDESKYEDINEYGKCLYSTMNKEFPNFGIEYVSASKRPFGLKVKIDNKTFKLHTKLKGRYIVLCASKV